VIQTWIQDLLLQDQDQDQDFDVQDQDRDSRLTRPILEVHDWDGLWQTKKTEKSQQNIIPCLTTVLFRQLPLIIAVYQTFANTSNISKVRCLINN